MSVTFSALVFFYLMHVPFTVKNAWYMLNQVCTIFLAMHLWKLTGTAIESSFSTKGFFLSFHFAFWALITLDVK